MAAELADRKKEHKAPHQTTAPWWSSLLHMVVKFIGKAQLAMLQQPNHAPQQHGKYHHPPGSSSSGQATRGYAPDIYPIYKGVSVSQFEVCASIVGAVDAASALNIIKHGIGYNFPALLYHSCLDGVDYTCNFGRHMADVFERLSNLPLPHPEVRFQEHIQLEYLWRLAQCADFVVANGAAEASAHDLRWTPPHADVIFLL